MCVRDLNFLVDNRLYKTAESETILLTRCLLRVLYKVYIQPVRNQVASTSCLARQMCCSQTSWKLKYQYLSTSANKLKNKSPIG